MDHFLNLRGEFRPKIFSTASKLGTSMSSWRVSIQIYSSKRISCSPVWAGEWNFRILTLKRDLVINKMTTLNRNEIYRIYGCPAETLFLDHYYGTLGVLPGRMTCMITYFTEFTRTCFGAISEKQEKIYFGSINTSIWILL